MKKLLLFTMLLLASVGVAQAQKFTKASPDLKAKAVTFTLQQKMKKNVVGTSVASRPNQAPQRAAGSTPVITLGEVTYNSATLSWEGDYKSYNVRYRETPADVTEEPIFFEGFEVIDSETGLPEGWTSIDADGDGYNWESLTASGDNVNTHGGDGLLSSASYINNLGALTPDNWLITPQLDLQGTLKMWMYGQDPSWSAEHFAVYVSTTGNSIADFDVQNPLIPETVVTGNYVQYSADLSQYAGQKGYIAIRHFNITDMFRLNLDDFGIYAGDDDEGWTVLTTEDNTITLTDLEAETSYDVQVQGNNETHLSDWSPLLQFSTPEYTEPVFVVEVPETATIEDDWSIQASGSKDISMATQVAFDGSDIYFQGVAYWFPEGWIKGTFEDGVASFPSGQLIGEDSYGPEYIASIDGEPIEFAYDEETQTFTMTSSYLLETSGPEYDGSSVYAYFSSMTLFKGEIVEPEPVVAPDELQTVTYTWTGYDLTFEDTDDDETTENEPVYTEFSRFVNIGFDGNDVYVQGLCEAFPEAWIKGTLDGSTVTFPTGQFFGKDDSWVSWGYPADYYYFVGYGDNGIQDVTFTYDANNNYFSSEDWIIINSKESTISYYSINVNNEFSLFNEVAGTPVDPEITNAVLTDTSYPRVNLNITLETVDGDAMVPSKVYYRIFIDEEHDVQQLAFEPEDYPELGIEEALLDIPYLLADDWDIYKGGSIVYFNQDLDYENINQVGAQVVYYGGDEEHESNIVWYFVKDYTPVATGIANVTASEGNDTWYTVDGRKLSAKPTTKGVFIRNKQKVVNK